MGGLYALLGAVAVAELAALMPVAGGFRVYAARAFGDGPGFVIGWTDWLCTLAALAYGSIAAATFLGALWPAALLYPRTVSVAILGTLTGLHWFGVKIGSRLTSGISLAVGSMLMILVGGCFFTEPVSVGAAAPLTKTVASLPWRSAAMLGALVTALRSVLVTYDGWYSPIYTAEESTDPSRTMPLAIIGGALLVAILYVLINIALLRVLPLPVLAASALPAADVARAVLPRGGAELVTIISLVTVLNLINAGLLMAPRILLGLGRDGFFVQRAAVVGGGGTPQVALGMSSVVTAILILTGTFEQIVAMAAVLFLLCYLSAYASVFALRRSAGVQTRPYRAFGYPLTTAVAFVGTLLFLVAAVLEDPRSGEIAGGFLLVCTLVYRWIRRRRLTRRAP